MKLTKKELVELYKITQLPDSTPHKVSKRVQISAVLRSGYNIQNLQDPCEEAWLIAIENNSFILNYLKNPSEKVQIAAIRRYPNYFCTIKGLSQLPLSEKVLLEAIDAY